MRRDGAKPWVWRQAPRIYLGAVAALAAAAFLPTKTNTVAYVALVVVGAPGTVVAVPVTLLVDAVVFGDPSRNDLAIALVNVAVFVAAAAAQVGLVGMIRRASRERRDAFPTR